MGGLWYVVERWTFMSSVRTTQGAGKPRRRKGYVFPVEPTLLGEVLLRGIAEGA